MKPNLKQAYPPDWKGMPMQMSARDRELWLRFQESMPEGFIHFYFDVQVGTPVVEAPEEKPEIKAMIEQTTRLRIDAVGEKKNEYWLIELRPSAMCGAIGSILTYKTLWEEDPIDDKIITPVIVTDNTNRNIISAAGRLKIIILLV